jgi:hypothetical protein
LLRIAFKPRNLPGKDAVQRYISDLTVVADRVEVVEQNLSTPNKTNP